MTLRPPGCVSSEGLPSELTCDMNHGAEARECSVQVLLPLRCRKQAALLLTRPLLLQAVAGSGTMPEYPLPRSFLVEAAHPSAAAWQALGEGSKLPCRRPGLHSVAHLQQPSGVAAADADATAGVDVRGAR